MELERWSGEQEGEAGKDQHDKLEGGRVWEVSTGCMLSFKYLLIFYFYCYNITRC